MPGKQQRGLRHRAAVRRRLRTSIALVVCFLAVSTPPAAGLARGVPDVRAGNWILRSSVALPVPVADQGVATVATARGGTMVLTRGGASVPEDLREQGWTHIGDPDSHAGYVLDAYQGSPAMHAKLFAVTSPSGRRSLFVHPLVSGESFHNSFTAITPDGQWFVSGEWGTVRRLLVFATPYLNPHAPRSPQNLPLASTITLAQPMRNVQGCAFDTQVTLVCSTNDPNTDLYPVARQLLLVRLPRRLSGRATTATVSLLGAVPQDSTCFGPGETEGVDIHGDRLLLAVVSPCNNVAWLYTYTARHGAKWPS